MQVNFWDLTVLVISGSIALNLLVDLLFYELRIHFANNYVVKIHYNTVADVADVNSTATYAIKALDENDAYIYAIKKFAKLRSIGDITSTSVSKID